jgi:hypothetical protein
MLGEEATAAAIDALTTAGLPFMLVGAFSVNSYFYSAGSATVVDATCWDEKTCVVSVLSLSSLSQVQ